MQSPATIAEGLSAPLFGAYTVPPFKFQPRRETVDWRRISALDVDRVARELDVAALQENIAGVTFCNLEREACSRCGQPVDPALLKVLRLAQLTIEYLLHCQDCLSASVAQLEARLQASLGQQERGQQELGRQADELKGVREESRRRRKMIGTLQQLLLHTGAHSYRTCHLCDKTFMNATFLRGHIQRRHQGPAEGGKQGKQEQPVEEVLEELRAKLKWTQGELEAQREAERQRQLQEAEITRQRETDAKREFDEWKEKERAQLYGEIDKLKHLFWDEFKNVANHNSTLAEKLQALQSHAVTESNLGSLRDEEPEEQLRQAQKLQALKEKMDLQKTEWKRKMKELQEEHTAEKRELQEENERLQASLSQDQRKATAQAQRQIDTLRGRLQEQARLLAAQEQTIQTLTARKAEGSHEVPKAADTEEESSEEELDSGDGQRKVLAALRQNPTLLKQFRPILEETLEEKLESMGVQRAAQGISLQTLRHLESILRAQREHKARRFSEFLSLREKLIKEANSRVKGRERAGGSLPEGALAARSPKSSLVTRGTQPKARTLHVAPLSHPAEPPRTSLLRRGSHGPGLTPHVPPFYAPQSAGALQPPSFPGARAERALVAVGTLANFPRPAFHPYSDSHPSLLLGDSTPPFSSEDDSERERAAPPQPPRGPSRMGLRQEDDWDWSDTDTSGDPALGSGTLVQSMVRNLEKQLEGPVKKPAGGVDLFLMPRAGPQKAAAPGRKTQLSDDESDLEISSLEELPQDQREKPKPLARSKLPGKFGASAWSAS